MALWQYDFSLVPEYGMIQKCGFVPGRIDDYFCVDDPETFFDPPSFWAEFDSEAALGEELKIILGKLDSCIKDAIMFGSDDGNKVTIWKEGDVNCRFDLRNPDLEILESILRLARKNKCKVLSHPSHKVIEPVMIEVTMDIRESGAYKFCKNPKEYLSSMAKDNHESEQDDLGNADKPHFQS
ncbi:MAG: hypothetical protein O7C75_19480 [Verrucomicrobia bacterium]|nr:hypothetical protein [Verrucomicrobiota bacterium]